MDLPSTVRVSGYLFLLDQQNNNPKKTPLHFDLCGITLAVRRCSDAALDQVCQAGLLTHTPFQPSTLTASCRPAACVSQKPGHTVK